MPNFASGKSCCTASARTCAAEWRIVRGSMAAAPPGAAGAAPAPGAPPLSLTVCPIVSSPRLCPVPPGAASAASAASAAPAPDTEANQKRPVSLLLGREAHTRRRDRAVPPKFSLRGDRALGLGRRRLHSTAG